MESHVFQFKVSRERSGSADSIGEDELISGSAGAIGFKIFGIGSGG